MLLGRLRIGKLGPYPMKTMATINILGELTLGQAKHELICHADYSILTALRRGGILLAPFYRKGDQ